ncbi:MAG: hypothetical protein LRY51_01980 [Geovibrio sp.]|nr:hypothetical protein [Geovibrio sp.]
MRSFDNALYYLKDTGEGYDGCMLTVRAGIEGYLSSFYGGADLLNQNFASEINRFSVYSSRCLEQSEISDWSGVLSYMTDIRSEHSKADRLMIAFSFFYQPVLHICPVALYLQRQDSGKTEE